MLLNNFKLLFQFYPDNTFVNVLGNIVSKSEVLAGQINSERCNGHAYYASNLLYNYSSTTGSNSWYKAISIKADGNDSHSQVSSMKYCTTTSSTCTPTTSYTSGDSVSLDKLPYIGEFSTFMPNMYIATGFKKWGMTTSNIAANIICDMICGVNNNYSYLFDSKRFSPVKNSGEMKNMLVEIADSLVVERFKLQKSKTPTCTHLGCKLNWNNALKTWDCPCHGSRFDSNGKCLYGPANTDLKKLKF